MRTPGSLLALALLLAGVLPVPGAAAQAPSTLLDDPIGDVVITAGDQRPTSPVPTQAADLVSLSAAETKDDFLFTLGVAGFAQKGDPSAVASDYRIHFRHHDQSFRVSVFQFNADSADGFFARLEQFDAGQSSWVPITQVPVLADINGGLATATVARSLLKDTSGAAPFPGRVLDAFYADSRGLRTFSGNINVQGTSPGDVTLRDRMPDDGEGGVALTVTQGLQQTGHARLVAREPFRASNGEATTFVFRVNATSHAEQPDTFRLSTVGVPANWEVTTPGGIRLDAHETLEVPVVVRTPFAHAHGSSVPFVLEMQSQSDPASVGRVELGVYYPAIPQPAGHHDTVTLRSRYWTDDQVGTALLTAFGTAFGFDALRGAYMNAAEADETDQQVPVGGFECDFGMVNNTVVNAYCWDIPLEPGLLMGLDFDLARTGELRFPVHSVLPLPNARLEGELVHYGAGASVGGFDDRDEGVRTVLATFVPGAGVEVGPNGDGLLTAVVQPTPEGDLVPYQAGAALRLEAVVRFDRPDNPFFGPRVPPELMPGGSLQLPLLEYEDPVDESFDVGGLLALEPVTEQERRVNPGRTVVFVARLTNNGPSEDTFRFAISGPHAEWAALAGDDEVRLAPGAGAEVRFGVAVPEGTADGEKADLVLQAESRTDLNVQALLRFKAVVDSSEPIPDESIGKQGGGKKGSPGLPAPVLLAVVVALAALALRRRT